MKALGIGTALFLGVIALVAASIALNGFMLSYLWQWFVVPLGVRSVGIPQAIGIAMLVSMLTREVADEKGKEDEALGRLLKSVAIRLVGFGIAFGLSFMVPA